VNIGPQQRDIQSHIYVNAGKTNLGPWLPIFLMKMYQPYLYLCVAVGGGLLTHLLLFFFIGVAEDDDLAVVRQPKDITVDVAKESSGELLITQCIRDETLLIRR
jgi:hypothetical protein